MRGHEPGPQVKRRADVFRYVDLEIERNTLKGHYELDERRFEETINFEGVGPLDQPAVRSLAELWHLLAGLSYYKAGARSKYRFGFNATWCSG